MVILFTLRVIARMKENCLRKISYSYFVVLVMTARGFPPNKPTHHLLAYGDFKFNLCARVIENILDIDTVNPRRLPFYFLFYAYSALNRQTLSP